MKIFLSVLILLFFSTRMHGQSIQPAGPINICGTGTAALSATGAPNGATFQWQLNGVDIAGATSINYTATATGNYSVTITNAVPVIILPAVAVSITPPPVVDFNFTGNNSCSGTAVSFTALISNGTAPFSYSWNFGDGQTSSEANPAHAFTSLGCSTTTFNVQLTITDSKGCKGISSLKSITIIQAPDVQVTDPQSPGRPFNNCNRDPSVENPNYTITVNNISPSINCIASYSIDWGDGTNGTNISFPLDHTYTTLGVFNLKISGVGTNGCSYTKSYVVANQKNPDIGLGTFGPTEGCANLPVNIVLSLWTTNSPGTTYTLDYGDGASINLTHPLNNALTNDTLKHIYTTTSCPNIPVYSIKVTATNACRSKTFTGGDVVVKIKPQSDFIILKTPACIGTPVCFQNSSKSGFDVNCSVFGTTQWDFGDPQSGSKNTSTENSPCHVYSTAGIYTVMLTTTNVCGPSTIAKTVCITLPPGLSFRVVNPKGCVPLTTAIIDDTEIYNSCEQPTYKWSVEYTPSTCDSTSSWNFANGTTDTMHSPSFTFNTAGTYNIILTENNACGTFHVNRLVEVGQKPRVNINPISAICANGTINPSAVVNGCNGTNPLQYNWTFTNGNPTSSINLVPGNINYAQLGNQPIELSVTNECGITTATTAVNITAPPVANAGVDKIICSLDSVQIGSNAIAGINYQWQPVIGLTSPNEAQTTISLTYNGVNADTAYIYVVTASAGATCFSTDTVLVTVKKRPLVNVAPLNSTICAGSSIKLTATGATTYNWSPSSSLNNSNSAVVSASPDTSTTYIVTGTDINGCKNTATAIVTVQVFPTINAGNDSTVCTNTTTVQLNGSPVGGNWSGLNITTNGIFNPQAAGIGVYTLYYTITQGLCSKTDSLRVTVLKPPIAYAGNDTTICQSNAPIQLNASPAGGSWSGSTSITTSGIFIPSATGIYSLVYTSTAGSCSTQDTVLITVSPGITNNVISANQSICINTPAAPIVGQVALGGNGSTGYQWQISIDSLIWTNIPNETNLNFTPPVLDSTTFYRRLAFTTLCAGTQGSVSNPVKITINPNAKALFTASPTSACAPFDLAKAIIITPYPNRNKLYQWLANGILIGSDTTGIFPGYTIINSAEIVLINLITTSSFGCKPDTLQQQFVSAAGVNAKFIKDTSGGCGALPVKFTNTSSVINGVQFLWNFGNGITSNIAQPDAIIFNPGPDNRDTIYRVTLKAFNGCDTTTWQDSIKIRANPKARFGVDTTFGCAPFTVRANNTSLGGPNTYYWNFGNGHLDTTYTNGILAYTYQAGNRTDTFSIQLIAANECKRDTQRINIRVAPNNLKPAINVNATDLFGCAPHVVVFNNSTTGATSFTWNFGDGSPNLITNNNQDVVHSFGSTGTFNISIKITNGCSDTTVYRSVTVYTKPTAGFTLNTAIYCGGDTVRVNNSSLNATNYQWFWGDGTGSTDSMPNHVYTAPGNYIIYLQAEKTNNFGLVCYDTLIRSITVLGKPNVTILSNINSINCAPFTLAVSAPGIINETITWVIFDSTANPHIITATGINTQYKFIKPGTFYVKLLARNATGCLDSTITPFTVKGNPVAAFTPANLAICTRDTTISYLNTSTYNGDDGIKYSWLVDGVPLSVNGNFTHQYTAAPIVNLPKSFITQLVVFNTVGCSDTATATLQMNPAAKALFSISNTNNCVPFSPAITNNSNFAGMYKWYLNGQLVSTATEPVLTITKAATLFTLTLIANNSYGCKPDSFSITFTSRIKPVAAFTVSDTLGCTGTLNVATNNTTSNANTYIWDWGDNTPATGFTNPTHLYTAPGEYLISLVASDGVCKDTVSQPVKVSIKPIADFAVNTTLTCDTARVQFTNQTVNGNSYLWSFGDGSTSTEINPAKSFAPSLNLYTVKLVANGSFGCKDSIVKANLITAKLAPAADFFISPTPVITIPNYTFSFNNLTANNSNYQYTWSLGDGGIADTRNVINYKYADTGSYPVRLIVFDNISNCADTILKTARITGFPGFMFIPNAICPNCMQENLRTFLPKGTGLKDYRLQIFTIWGELVFETTSLDSKGAPNQPWDAKYKGSLVQQDAYVWKIQAKFRNGSEWLGMLYPGETEYKKAGSITVVK